MFSKWFPGRATRSPVPGSEAWDFVLCFHRWGEAGVWARQWGSLDPSPAVKPPPHRKPHRVSPISVLSWGPVLLPGLPEPPVSLSAESSQGRASLLVHGV